MPEGTLLTLSTMISGQVNFSGRRILLVDCATLETVHLQYLLSLLLQHVHSAAEQYQLPEGYVRASATLVRQGSSVYGAAMPLCEALPEQVCVCRSQRRLRRAKPCECE